MVRYPGQCLPPKIHCEEIIDYHWLSGKKVRLHAHHHDWNFGICRNIRRFDDVDRKACQQIVRREDKQSPASEKGLQSSLCGAPEEFVLFPSLAEGMDGMLSPKMSLKDTGNGALCCIQEAPYDVPFIDPLYEVSA